jgi:SAM-dependent methyltransferase
LSGIAASKGQNQMAANEDQIKFWNEKAGQNWTIQQAWMDANMADIGDAALAFAAVKPDMAVLDVGCGTGATSLAMAQAGAKVTGVDISKPMLGLARERAAEAGLPIAFIEADASNHLFTPDFDLIFSRFGVMFFDAPVPAFANMRKGLKPGGRIAFVCWRTPPENPWASAPLLAAKPLLPEQPPPDPLAPGPFAFADPKRIEDILTQSGFSGIRIEKLDGAMTMGTDLGFFAAQMLQIGPLSRAAAEVDSQTRDRIVQVVQDAMARFVRADGEIAPPAACWLVAAQA